jgi:adenine-specific DNA-methyltransferase
MALTLAPTTPKKALNKAFLKQRPLRSDIDLFKANLKLLLDKINDTESEENQKNHIRDFLRDTYYKNTNEINTKGRQDMVIHLDKTNESKVGVIIEAKKPSNKTDWITAEKPNGKAIHELVLYYMRERIEEKNIDVKYVIATNIYEWYIIEASYFDKLFLGDKKFVKAYEDWRDGKKATKNTDLFYNDIAKPFIEQLDIVIPCTYFDLRDYEAELKNEDTNDDKKLIELFKIFSKYHLLKESFANDSNELNNRFYKELLHIIGLEEIKLGGKLIIQRKDKDRSDGSMLENTINILETDGSVNLLPNKDQFGETKEDRIFNIALELNLTWINRILFLKLLEGQLATYHQSDKKYKFLNKQIIFGYDELYKLFHQVLAVKIDERKANVKEKYQWVPYLNSSLFEISPLEMATIKISQLDPYVTLNVMNGSILSSYKNASIDPVQYLFEFLDAYDFSSEGSGEIQEDNKVLINASVLGKVFEKINGYKDGSIYTPGFITMYMCNQSLRRSVIQKMNDAYQWKAEHFDDLKNYLVDKKTTADILDINKAINTTTICDPAVGSGHFLVSALNEMISIKHDLGILCDEKGVRIAGYDIGIENDELIVTHQNGDVFQYIMANGKPISKEDQRLQRTLFHEKQAIIENSLFGVDINPNSVKICRLRLWIELLKNAYYKEDSAYQELETLPNIDINIKCGNSLISRFKLEEDLSKVLKSIKYDIKTYRSFVQEYKNCKDREAKQGLELIIDNIKGDFRTEIGKNDPKQVKLKSLSGELFNLLNQTVLIDDDKTKKAREDKKIKLELEVNKLASQIEDIKSNAIYRDAFEWRFEFPEVLNDDGDFVGFDLVIGNPPYFSVSNDSSLKEISSSYKTWASSGDIYSLFYELGQNILNQNGLEILIISNKWMRANYGENLRNYIISNSNPLLIVDFGQNLIFDNAIVHTNIIMSGKGGNKNQLEGIRFEDGKFFNFVDNFGQYIDANLIKNLNPDKGIWNINSTILDNLKSKIEKFPLLKEWKIKMNFGIKTGLNEAFIIDAKTRQELIAKDPKSEEIIKPILRGRDTRRYYCNFADLYLLNTHNGYSNLAAVDVENNYPVIYNHLQNYKEDGMKRYDKGKHWTNLRNCAYLEDFNKPKIIFSEIVSEPQFYYDELGYYPEATVFIITGEKLKYLTALLNSKPVTFFFKSFYMGGELVGKIRYKKAFVEQIPIPNIDDKTEIKFNSIVDQIIALKKEEKDSTALEQKIDKMVYELYGLTPEEIEVVEGKK